MGMTHIIRGDDHKINTFKQIQIYLAMNWNLPAFAHIPLIHTIEGKKLSKRDNASTLDDYSKIGIMPDALRNYLLRLGWSYEDKEIFTLEELWACTTCNACVESCPIGIDPLSIIVDMRRYMVMEQSSAPTELNNMMNNIENNGAPWPFNQLDRLNWKN
jgi:glutamyl/glutaminyl-tRNA synthetase